MPDTYKFGETTLELLRIECRYPKRHHHRMREDYHMFSWALLFLIVALIAGVLGFGGVAVISVEMAKIIFTVAIILFLISVVAGIMRGRSMP
jgi:uncharacterized membrane protein YtjA (UPF0391 family)